VKKSDREYIPLPPDLHAALLASYDAQVAEDNVERAVQALLAAGVRRKTRIGNLTVVLTVIGCLSPLTLWALDVWRMLSAVLWDGAAAIRAAWFGGHAFFGYRAASSGIGGVPFAGATTICLLALALAGVTWAGRLARAHG
jgi:hypothetical protein